MIFRLVLAVVLAFATTGCTRALPVPGGWVGPDPVLYVRGDVVRDCPLCVDWLERAAKVYRGKGEREVRIREWDGSGPKIRNEVRMANGPEDLRDLKVLHVYVGPGKNSLAYTVQKGTVRIIYIFRSSRGREIRFVPHGECDVSKRSFSARMMVFHELGHFLGFDHSNNADHVMFAEAKCVTNPIIGRI